MGLNPILVSALAPFGLVKVGAEIGAELENFQIYCKFSFGNFLVVLGHCVLVREI